MRRNLLALCAFSALAVSSRAGVIVNDTWLDSTRTDPTPANGYSENGVDGDLDGNLESSWYTSNAAGLTVAPGHLTQATVTGSTSWTTYYTPESGPVDLTQRGSSMKLTWVFTPSGVANDGTNNTGQNFRLGIVDSPSASRVTTDQAPGAPSGGNYNGYAMFMNMDQTLRRSTPFQLMRRTSGTAAFLGTGADWVGIANNGTTNDPGYTSGTQYTYTMTLTHNAMDGMDIVSRMEGAGLGAGNQGFLQVSFTDATPNSFTYDTFGVRPSGSATSATSFDTNLFKVETTVPEPASLAMMGIAGSVLLRRRNRG